MMFSWLFSPLGRWLSLVGAIVAMLSVTWLKGRAAGKAGWDEKRRAAREKCSCSRELVGTCKAHSKPSGYYQGAIKFGKHLSAMFGQMS